MGSFGGSKHIEPEKVDRKKFEIAGAKDDRKRAMTREQAAASRGQKSGDATQGLIQDLTKQSRGEGPSLAQAQLKQSQDRTLAQQLAAVQSSRPANAALGARQAMRAGAQTQQQNAATGAQLRLQEQAQAQQLLSQTAGQESAMQNQLTQQYMGMGFDMAQAQQAAAARAEELQLGLNTGATQLTQQNLQQNADRNMQLAGSVMSATGGVMGSFASAGAKSDKASKKNIKKADKDMDGFLKALSAKKYNYKNEQEPGTFPGENYGVMAQDLEKSKVGKTLVTDTPTGKMVDTKKGFGAVLAAQSRLQERLSGLEKLLGKDKKRGK